LLLFNIEYNCYVVIELKVTELKKEHIGQIQVYMNYIDENIRKIGQDKTIGIIICKQDNKYIIKYCSDDRIIARTYELVWFYIKLVALKNYLQVNNFTIWHKIVHYNVNRSEVLYD